MPNMKVVNMAGKEVGTIELSEKVFGRKVNEAVLHTAVRAFLMNQRQGTQSTLTRSEVSGGGRKPWKQKGTGHARQGSTRSPQWTHGGIALGPKPRSYRVTLNKATKKAAMFSALSSKVSSAPSAKSVCSSTLSISVVSTVSSASVSGTSVSTVSSTMSLVLISSDIQDTPYYYFLYKYIIDIKKIQH